MESEARATFVALLSGADEAIELDRVALAIARSEYPAVEAERYLGRLDAMAAELRPRLSPEESPERLIAVLNTYLFGEEGFRGNGVDYYDPRNSYINEVLDRRAGIPITLSLIYLELGRRVGLAFQGVSFPGHFIVRWSGDNRDLFIDPFNQGAVLSVEDCADRLRQHYGSSLRFGPELLRPALRREIIVRMLHNLKGSYLRRGDLSRAIRSIEWALAANPDHLDERRELGLLRYKAGDFLGSAAELERFLEQQPDGPVAKRTRGQLRRVRELWIRRN